MPRVEPGTFSRAKVDKELAELLKNPPKQLCVIGHMIAEHPNGADIAEALSNPRWTAPQLANVISSKVRQTSAGAITAHRNKNCACER